MENNIFFICPSWEDRSLLGFKQNCDDVKTSKVIALRKEQPINEYEISRTLSQNINIIIATGFQCFPDVNIIPYFIWIIL